MNESVLWDSVADGVVVVSRRPDRGRLVQVAKELGAPALPLLARGVDAVPARVLLLDVLNQAIAPAHRGEVLVAPVAALHRAGKDSGVVQVRLQHIGAKLVHLPLLVHVLAHRLEGLGLVCQPEAPRPLQPAARAPSPGRVPPISGRVRAQHLGDLRNARGAVIDDLAHGPLVVVRRGLLAAAVHRRV